MLMKKENTNYGYKARLRYDVKNPTIHVVERGGFLKLTGEADITVVSGQLSIMRMDGTKKIYDKLTSKDTYRLPKDNEVICKPLVAPVVVIEDNNTKNKIERYLDLSVVEDEPSSDDLNYIDDE